jgi:acyl-CoA thioesterase FadM
MDATYRSTATIDDVLDLDVRCDHVGNMSLVLTYSITRDGEAVFTGTARYVNIDDSGQPIPVPAAVRSAVHTR